MPATFCTTDGCFNPAVKAPRSTEHCRGCYNSKVLADVELVKFKVTADNGAKVTDARTQESKGNGHTVELGPMETNIAALVFGGFGVVVTDTPAAKKAAERAKG